MSLNDQVLAVLTSNPTHLSVDQIAAQLACTNAQARSAVRSLRNQGMVSEVPARFAVTAAGVNHHALRTHIKEPKPRGRPGPKPQEPKPPKPRLPAPDRSSLNVPLAPRAKPSQHRNADTERLWRTARILKTFDEASLAMASEVRKTRLRLWLRAMIAAGYVRWDASGERYLIVARRCGPNAPSMLKVFGDGGRMHVLVRDNNYHIRVAVGPWAHLKGHLPVGVQTAEQPDVANIIDRHIELAQSTRPEGGRD